MSVTIYTRNVDEGLGEVSINMSNRNFATLWSALGFEVELMGEMDARKLRSAVNTMPSSLMIRPSTTDGNFIDCGVSHAQVDRYIETFTQLCDEAERMETPVQWA